MSTPTPSPQADTGQLQPDAGQSPAAADEAEAATLESELAAAFGTKDAVVVSAGGTAAIHAALEACGIRPGDEVLVPAATVIMTVAAITHARARPVLVDTDPSSSGLELDLDDLAAKRTPRTRAVLPVHLGGRTGRLEEVEAFAAEHGLVLIEDACQAQGSRYRGRLAGTIGTVGCFSLHKRKLLTCDQGGYLLTNHPEVAERARAIRSHWQTGAAGSPAGSRLGYNYRLAEPLAALTRRRLPHLAATLTRRRHQTGLLYTVVGADTPGLTPIPPGPGEEPNGFSALWRLHLPQPRAFCRHLAARGVVNSVGTFGLQAASQHPACQHLNPAPCPHAAAAVDRLLAVTPSTNDSDQHLRQLAERIRQEAHAWAA